MKCFGASEKLRNPDWLPEPYKRLAIAVKDALTIASLFELYNVDTDASKDEQGYITLSASLNNHFWEIKLSPFSKEYDIWYTVDDEEVMYNENVCEYLTFMWINVTLSDAIDESFK